MRQTKLELKKVVSWLVEQVMNGVTDKELHSRMENDPASVAREIGISKRSFIITVESMDQHAEEVDCLINQSVARTRILTSFNTHGAIAN